MNTLRSHVTELGVRLGALVGSHRLVPVALGVVSVVIAGCSGHGGPTY